MNVDVLLEGKPNLERLSQILDELSPMARLAAVRSWDGDQLARLFEAAKGFRKLSVDDLVPASEPLVEVIHRGKNSMPLFSTLEKRFARTAAGVAGYNHQSMRWITGPGYFLVDPGDDGELLVDYRKLPKEHPTGWPEIRGSVGIGWFVFGGMVDVLRGISKHVSIGSAHKRGKSIGIWFVLCREDT